MQKWLVGSRYNGEHTVWTYEDSITEYYDGDGHSLKSYSTYDRLYVTPAQHSEETRYRIWSSVLNAALTSVKDTGLKDKTNVFAGGAVIATQSNDGSSSAVGWTLADPVTGSSPDQQFEPFGETVDPTQPDDTEVLSGRPMNSVDEPEWMCGMYDGTRFWDSPVQCQKATIENFDIMTFVSGMNRSNPKYVDRMPTLREMLNVGNISFGTATNKPRLAGKTEGAVPPSALPSKDGSMINLGIAGVVQVNGNDPRLIDMTSIPGLDAEHSGGENGGIGFVSLSGPKAVFDKEKFDKCLKKFTGAVVFAEKFEENGPGREDDVLTTRLTIDGKPATITTSVEQSALQLGQLLASRGIGGGGPNSGATTDLSPSHNYIASEVYQNVAWVEGTPSLYTNIGFLALKMHEIANAAAGIRFQRGDSQKNIGEFKDDTLGMTDHDAGAAVEKCAFGGIVNLRTGRIGNSRGL